MSKWSYITASLEVDTYNQEKDIKGFVEKSLLNAPKITGSERDADVFVNLLSGYNLFIGSDCQQCEYFDTIEILEDNIFTCGADKGYKCPEGNYQTCVLISISGSLRDKTKGKTEKEYEAFKKFLTDTCKFDIENESVNIL